jgi:divalent metal cation (Fe/Co/Zn/Cd) transporter
LLARESRSLLIGEGISPGTEQAITSLVEKDGSVQSVRRFFSIYQSPEEVLLVLLVAFHPEISAAELPDRIEGIKNKIRRQYHKITYIIVQPE